MIVLAAIIGLLVGVAIAVTLSLKTPALWAKIQTRARTILE